METKINKNTMENKKGLNRTMQYGNMTIGAFLIVDPPSLNRTMQYGNNRRTIHTDLEKKV